MDKLNWNAGAMSERFWSKVQIGPPDKCWLWLGAKKAKGHGNFRLGDKQGNRGRYEQAHRIMYEACYGKPPEGVVMHSCDNGWCVNPLHLTLGTQLENMQDRDRKGRHRPGGKKPFKKRV